MTQVSQATSGEWHVGGREQCTIYDKFDQRIANTFEGVMVSQRSDAECQANAILIAEAGTVHHETGLTPRQLVEQRDALVYALEAMTGFCDEHADFRNGVTDPTGAIDEGNARAAEYFSIARAALALVKGEQK